MLKNGARIICVHGSMYFLSCFYSCFRFIPFTNHTVTILKHLMPGFWCGISMLRVHLCLYASIWVWWILQYVNTSLIIYFIFVFYYLWIVKWKLSHISNRTFHVSVSALWKYPSKLLQLHSLQVYYTAAFHFLPVPFFSLKKRDGTW